MHRRSHFILTITLQGGFILASLLLLRVIRSLSKVIQLGMCQGQDSNMWYALDCLSMAYLWVTEDLPGDLSHNLLNSCHAPSRWPLINPLQQVTSKILSSRMLTPFHFTLLSRVSLKSLQAMVSTGSVGNTHPLPLQLIVQATP